MSTPKEFAAKLIKGGFEPDLEVSKTIKPDKIFEEGQEILSITTPSFYGTAELSVSVHKFANEPPAHIVIRTVADGHMKAGRLDDASNIISSSGGPVVITIISSTPMYITKATIGISQTSHRTLDEIEAMLSGEGE